MDLREHFPLTLAHLGPSRTPATARDVAELVESVCAAHAAGDIPSRAVRDLVRFEAMLLDLPPGPRGEGPTPERAACVLAPHVRLLVYGAALPEMLQALRAGQRATPRPSRGTLLAWRDLQGHVRELAVLRDDAWMLDRFREPAVPDDALEDDEDRELFARLWREGVIVHAHPIA